MRKFFLPFLLLAIVSFVVVMAPFNQVASFQNPGLPHKPVCPGPVASNDTRCHAQVVTNVHGQPRVTAAPSGYGPLQFLGAYNLTGNTPITRTIAIVDAYDDPNVLNDLNTYSSAFGIPTMSVCPVSGGTSTSPCFQKADQNGGTSYPGGNSGWDLEISLDTQIAHAMCQNCNILLVEANSASYTDLMTAVDRARLMGANVISNSYGSGEFSGETTYDGHFNYPGIAFTFSSGDSGYGAQYPAASRYVTAVGGTTLSVNNTAYAGESVWSGAGSGCSSFESKPNFQKDTGCTNRTVADVSADADPSTGASVYDSVPYQGQSGWFQVGGTSLASPLVAAVYALAGSTSGQMNAVPYANGVYGQTLHDVTSGNNGTCSPAYLCTGMVGYDGPSGLGTPFGTGAFGGSVTVPTPTPTPIPPTPTPTIIDTAPPSVTITNPVNGSFVPRNSFVTLAASASDDTYVATVNFYVNGSLLCSDPTNGSGSYSCLWKVPGRRNTTYTITVTAIDAANFQTSKSVSVTAK